MRGAIWFLITTHQTCLDCSLLTFHHCCCMAVMMHCYCLLRSDAGPWQGFSNSGRFSQPSLSQTNANHIYTPSLFTKPTKCWQATPVLILTIPIIAMPSNTLERRVAVKRTG